MRLQKALMIAFGLILGILPALTLTHAHQATLNGAIEPASANDTTRATESPFIEPKVIYSKDGVLDATLQLCLTKNRVADREIATGTYNGGIPGPTFRVKPGDTL